MNGLNRSIALGPIGGGSLLADRPPMKQPSGLLSNAKDRAGEQTNRLEDMVSQLESWLLQWRGPVPSTAGGDGSAKSPPIDSQLSDWHATLDRQARALDQLSVLIAEIYSL